MTLKYLKKTRKNKKPRKNKKTKQNIRIQKNLVGGVGNMELSNTQKQIMKRWTELNRPEQQRLELLHAEQQRQIAEQQRQIAEQQRLELLHAEQQRLELLHAEQQRLEQLHAEQQRLEQLHEEQQRQSHIRNTQENIMKEWAIQEQEKQKRAEQDHIEQQHIAQQQAILRRAEQLQTEKIQKQTIKKKKTPISKRNKFNAELSKEQITELRKLASGAIKQLDIEDQLNDVDELINLKLTDDVFKTLEKLFMQKDSAR